MGRLVPALVAAALLVPALAPAAPAAPRHHHRGPQPGRWGTLILDPKAFIAKVYDALSPVEPGAPPHNWGPPDDFYTPRLAALFALDKRETPKGDIGRLDFYFWVDGTEWDLHDIKITVYPQDVTPTRRVVIAKFTSIHEPKEIHYYFEKVGGRWLLDDARSVTGHVWTLSTILKYGNDAPYE